MDPKKLEFPQDSQAGRGERLDPGPAGGETFQKKDSQLVRLPYREENGGSEVGAAHLVQSCLCGRNPAPLFKMQPQIKTLKMGLGREPLNSPSHCATWAHLPFLLLTPNLTVSIGSLKVNS